MRESDFIILGGGWAGLLCGYELKKRYRQSKITILEASEANRSGGLLSSEIIDGFTFDTAGPHILFSRNQNILEEIVSFLGDNVKKIERKAFVFFQGKYVPYPFENGIYVLDAQERAEFGSDILAAMLKIAGNQNWKPKTFKDWIYGYFGNAIAREYLEPYNRKIWKTDPIDMDADWVFSPGRLPFPDLKEIVSSISGLKSIGYKEQAYFYYPKNGGIKSLYDSLYKKVVGMGVEFISNFTVRKVEKNHCGWLINDTYTCAKIINTLPIIVLPKIFNFPLEINNIISKLDYNREIVVGIALKKKGPEEHVVYVPDKEIIFHRLTWMSNLSEHNADNFSNLIAETTISMNTQIDLALVTKATIEGLLKMKIIDSTTEILFTKTWMNEYGYPIYRIGHQETRNRIFNFFKDNGIISVGRWGSWHYWNTDKVYEAVKEAVGNIDKSNSSTSL